MVSTTGRKSDNFVWQAKEASGSSGQVATRPHPSQTIPVRQSPEPQLTHQPSPNSLPQSLNAENPAQQDRAVVILPSDLIAYDRYNVVIFGSRI